MEPVEPSGVREAAHRAADLYADLIEGLAARRVDPGSDPDRLRALFSGSLTDEGVGLDATLRDFEERVLPHSMTTPHPCYWGLINSSPLPMAPLADMLTSALNNNNGAWHQSPASTAAEREVVDAFAAQLGIGDDVTGMVLPGGTFANLQGMLLARDARFPGWRARGPASVAARPLLYTSEAAHFSVARAGQVMGIGDENVVAIPTTGRGAMDPEALARRVTADLAEGARPFCVVTNVGTTGTGAVDPVAAIAEVCRAHDLWLHVDACYGGAAGLVPELADLLDGVGRADSVVVDAHKWFFVPITAALLFTRRPARERETFSVDASYIPQARDDDAFLRGLPTSRRGSGLVTWMALRAHGWDTIRSAVRRNVAQARAVEARLGPAGFEIMPDGRLSIACARWVPPGKNAEQLDALQAAIAADCVASGKTWFGTTRHGGKTWLRFNIVNLHTRDEHVREVADLVIETARRRAPR